MGLMGDKSRVGVCIDTCHAFAAGYDLRTETEYEKTWKKFERIVGFKYLLGLHLNDSRSTLGSGRDLHANIGYLNPPSSTVHNPLFRNLVCSGGNVGSRGFLGLEPFRLIVNDKRLQPVPMILETPAPMAAVWAQEIDLLYSMVGKGAGDEELAKREEQLQKLGEDDRKEQLGVLDRKVRRKAKLPVRRRKKKGDSESEEDDEEGSSCGEHDEE
jgi:AP endonuclease 1